MTPQTASRTETPAPSAQDWQRVGSTVNTTIDALNARIRRITTALTGFVRPNMLDSTETEIMAAANDLRELRLQVRQMRALAKADERRAAA